MAYIGKSPTGTGVRQRYYYTATGGETSLSGADDNSNTLVFSDGNYVDVSLNGIALVAGTDYNTTTANTIAGLSALSASDIVEIVVYDIFTVADTVSAKNGGTFSGNVTVNGTMTATSFTGSASGLTSIPSSQLSGALPAIDGSALTSLSSSALTGALPAIDGSALTGLGGGTSVAVIADQKAAGSSGGTGTTGTWMTRTLNTEISDPDGIVSISGSQFNLGAGNYLIQWSVPGFQVGSHQSRLYNATAASVVALGQSAFGSSSRPIQQNSNGSGYVSLGASANFQIQHRIGFSTSTEDLGYPSSFGTETYTIVTISKVG